jgi:hypothetical protein
VQTYIDTVDVRKIVKEDFRHIVGPNIIASTEGATRCTITLPQEATTPGDKAPVTEAASQAPVTEVACSNTELEPSDSKPDPEYEEHEKIVTGLAMRLYQAKQDRKTYEATSKEKESAKLVEPNVREYAIYSTFKDWQKGLLES